MTDKSKKILIIDDSNTNVVLLEAILSNKGYKTLTATSVREAVPLIEKVPPGLILLDLLMPQISGYKFLEDIKNNPQTKDIPVIVVTAVTEKESRDKIMELGATDYFEKPIDIKAFVQKVKQIINA